MNQDALTDAGDRMRCPHCAEMVPLEARICRHCQSSVLVDVVLAAPVTEARQRYQISRALQPIVGGPTPTRVQAGLADARRPHVAKGVTRAFAHEAVGVLLGLGVRASIEAEQIEPEKPASRGGTVRVIALAVLVFVAFTAWRILLQAPDATTAAPAAASGPVLSRRDLAKQSLPSTVSVRCESSVGSGFFITKELVITNAHVLCRPGEKMEVVLADGRKLAATTERADRVVDLGLVRVPGAAAKPLPLGDVADLQIGDPVMIIGSPIGLEFTVHEGSVSSLQRTTNGVAYVQLDAKINPGNSGGPVIDNHGRVVGVVTLKATGAEGIGLALPINYAYRSGIRFVEAPNPEAASSVPFAAMVAHAEGALAGHNREEVAQSRNDDTRPLLLAAEVDQYDRLLISVLRIQGGPPSYEEISAHMWSGSDRFCSMKGDVSDWTELDLKQPGGIGLPPKTVELLRGLKAGPMFLGHAPLRWDLCDREKLRSGIEIELEGGHVLANRIRLTREGEYEDPPSYDRRYRSRSVTTN